jgi:hypothetical protein
MQVLRANQGETNRIVLSDVTIHVIIIFLWIWYLSHAFCDMKVWALCPVFILGTFLARVPSNTVRAKTRFPVESTKEFLLMTNANFLVTFRPFNKRLENLNVTNTLLIFERVLTGSMNSVNNWPVTQVKFVWYTKLDLGNQRTQWQKWRKKTALRNRCVLIVKVFQGCQ